MIELFIKIGSTVLETKADPGLELLKALTQSVIDNMRVHSLIEKFYVNIV